MHGGQSGQGATRNTCLLALRGLITLHLAHDNKPADRDAEGLAYAHGCRSPSPPVAIPVPAPVPPLSVATLAPISLLLIPGPVIAALGSLGRWTAHAAALLSPVQPERDRNRTRGRARQRAPAMAQQHRINGGGGGASGAAPPACQASRRAVPGSSGNRSMAVSSASKRINSNHPQNMQQWTPQQCRSLVRWCRSSQARRSCPPPCLPFGMWVYQICC